MDNHLKDMNRKNLCPCGAICEACEKYPTDCSGCKNIKGKVWWLAFTGQEVCPFYACCVEQKQLEHCGKCASFPCTFFSKGDPTKSDEENRKILEQSIKVLTENR